MKKLMICLIAAGLTASVYSCRESTEQKAEDAIEAAGEDIERNTEKAAQEIEEGAEELEREIEEERNERNTVN